MMATNAPDSQDALNVENRRWRLDPSRSSVEFHVPHFYGLVTVKGRFSRYEGSLDLGSEPAVQLTIDSASLDTKMKKRDKHLRSADFFDADRHPEVQFVSDSASLDGDRLTVHGNLTAAGQSLPLELDATLHPVDGELEVEATTEADHTKLGMTWSPLGILRTPSKLVVKGRLIPDT